MIDVEDRRALLRLGDDALDLLAGGVGVDVVADLDAAEAVAHVGIDAEDAGQVHARRASVAVTERSCTPRFWATDGDAGGQAAGEPGEHDLHRRHAVVLGGEDLGVVGVAA